jgi:hypothetical protein
MKPSQLLKFAQLALQVARQHLPPYGSKYSPKKFTQPSLLACLLVKEYLRMDYRGLEDLLASSAELRAALGLESVPDHSTFHWFMRHRVTPTLLKAALATTLRLFRRRSRRGETVAVDATGFSRRPASHYYMRRMGRRQRARRFLMLSMVVWVRPQVICAQGVRVGPGSQSRLLPPLVQETVRHVAVRRLLADADYDSEPTHRWLREEQGIESIIPATGCRPGRARTPYRRRIATLFSPPEIRSTVDRRDGRFGPQAEIRRGPDDPPLVATGQAGSPAGFGLQPSAGRCGSGDFFASLGSSALPRGSTAVRNAYGIPTPMRFSTEQALP